MEEVFQADRLAFWLESEDASEEEFALVCASHYGRCELGDAEGHDREEA